MTLRQTVAPTLYPVDIDEAKAHLRVDISTDDDLIEALIVSATQLAEQITGRALMTQTLEYSCDAFPTEFELTRVPVQSVTSITYIDSAGATATLAANQYTILNDDFGVTRIVPAYGVTWPSSRGDTNGVKVTFVAGYTSALLVPSSIKTWMLINIAENHPGTMQEHQDYVDGLLDRYTVYG